ncbi:MAG: hypothetical protein M1383_06295 [Patescibacteria group bacterium]|nr:hypothetical protein [Patescibacteria group bacterium]
MDSQKQNEIMRWVSFVIVSILLLIAGFKNLKDNQPYDKTLTTLFLVVTGFAWGANLWRFFKK